MRVKIKLFHFVPIYFQMDSTRERREHSEAFHQFNAWLVKWFEAATMWRERKIKENLMLKAVQKHFKHHLSTTLHNFLLITKLLLLNMLSLQGRRVEIWGWEEAYPTRKLSPFSSKIVLISHPLWRELHLKCNKQETFSHAWILCFTQLRKCFSRASAMRLQVSIPCFVRLNGCKWNKIYVKSSKHLETFLHSKL